MKGFAALYEALDQTTSTSAKLAALERYFRTAPDDDRLWCIALFSGRRPRRALPTTALREWASEAAGIPQWLFDESYALVGDLAETIARVLPMPRAPADLSLSAAIAEIQGLRALDETARKAKVIALWDALPPDQRFLFNKLITGGFRVGVSQRLMTRALAAATDQPVDVVAHKLMGDWTADKTTFEALVLADDPTAAGARPYPFCLAHPVAEMEALGPVTDWLVEEKFDGIRAQVILREGRHHIWSRGEEPLTDKFPELAAMVDFLPAGTVLDGEILVWRDGGPGPFADLQKRIGRKTVPKKLLQDAPVQLLAYDLLEDGGRDIRDEPLARRRERLDALVSPLPAEARVSLSPQVAAESWDPLDAVRARARENGTEGLMLKRLDGPYVGGRARGNWWKWKVDPLSVDAVMIYAQQGHGRRAGLYTDFTFAVWDGPDLVPFAKAYSGLTDAEFTEISAWVRKNTRQRFGPVRQVPGTHVFEIAFEGIQKSTRHKSGIALRFPRMSRWRRDKAAGEANTLDDLKAMLKEFG